MKSKPDNQFLISAVSLALIVVILGGVIVYHSNSLDVRRVGPQRLIQAANVILATTSATVSEITHGDSSKKEVIFTFDGGGGIQSADAILSVLAKHHVKGTFFLTGKMVEAHPDVVKRIAAGGDEIFSHTYDHANLTTLTDQQRSQEFTKLETALQATAGISPKPYFRAPYGARDARVISIAAKNGYRSVFWTVDALDWRARQG